MKRTCFRRLAASVILFALLFALFLPAASAAGTEFPFVTDAVGLLTEADRAALESYAESLAEAYEFGFYIVTVEDFTDYGSGDVYDVAVAFYTENGLGYGADRDGEILLLSMAERDYALAFHGFGNSAFTDYGRDWLEDRFLDSFRENDWYGGFWSYLETSAYLVEQARAGNIAGLDSGTYDAGSGEYHSGESHSPFGQNGFSGFGLFDLLVLLVIPALIAGLVCWALYASMRSVRHAAYAGMYATGRPSIRISSDTYTHTTESRVKIHTESHDSGGSVSHSGGGFSGRSGKF